MEKNLFILFGAILAVTVILIFLSARNKKQLNLYRTLLSADYREIIPYFFKIKDEKLYGHAFNVGYLVSNLERSLKEKIVTLSDIKEVKDFATNVEGERFLENGVYFLRVTLISALDKVIMSYESEYFAHAYIKSLITNYHWEFFTRHYLLGVYNKVEITSNELDEGEVNDERQEKLLAFFQAVNREIDARLLVEKNLKARHRLEGARLIYLNCPSRLYTISVGPTVAVLDEN